MNRFPPGDAHAGMMLNGLKLEKRVGPQDDDDDENDDAKRGDGTIGILAAPEEP